MDDSDDLMIFYNRKIRDMEDYPPSETFQRSQLQRMGFTDEEIEDIIEKEDLKND